MKEQGCPRYRNQKHGPNEWKALHQMRGLNEDCLKGRDQPTDNGNNQWNIANNQRKGEGTCEARGEAGKRNEK